MIFNSYQKISRQANAEKKKKKNMPASLSFLFISLHCISSVLGQLLTVYFVQCFELLAANDRVLSKGDLFDGMIRFSIM